MLGNGLPRHHRPCGRTPLQRRPPSRHASFALYEGEPAGPPGKRFVGSSIWRTETVTVGPGHKPDLAIRADVEVPERKLAVTISMRRNTNQALRATHTIEVMFSLPADFPFGGINSVHGVLMKQAAATRGTPLSGSAIRVTPNIFLLGLSMLESDAQRNFELLKERSLVEIPVGYSNGRRAIIAVEKGTSGERAFSDAFEVWIANTGPRLFWGPPGGLGPGLKAMSRPEGGGLD